MKCRNVIEIAHMIDAMYTMINSLAAFQKFYGINIRANKLL